MTRNAKWLVRLVLQVVVFFAVLTPCLWAQTASTGALLGTVTDPQGAAVPNTTVTATNTGTGQMRTSTTGSDGAYRFTLLPPGTYAVRFEASGFKTTEIPSVLVNVTESPVLDRQLEIGAQTQEVTVQAQVEAVQTSSATLGTVLGTRAVSDLPLNTRNYVDLLSLSAGTSANVQNASALGKATQSIASNGTQAIQNNYQMDGASISNYDSGIAASEGGGSSEGFIGIPSPDSIQEFKIQTSTYDASYGKNSGASVNVVTKGGTNDFHGTAFEFFRNTVLNANDFFLNSQDKPRGALNQNQFGGVLGGPVKKDKVFFFGSYQRTWQKNGLAAGSLSNPVVPAIPTGDRTSAAWLNALYTDYCGKTGVQGGVALACTPGGPGAQISPVALNFLRLPGFNGGPYYIPSVNGGAGGLDALSIPAYYTENQFMVNTDYVLSTKNTLVERYFYAKNVYEKPFGNGATSFPGLPTTNDYGNQEAVVKLVSVLSNSLVNEARVSYQRNQDVGTMPSVFTTTEVGMTPLAPAFGQYLPNIPIAGFALGNAQFGLITNIVNQYQVADQISWTHGKHSIRAGGEGAWYPRWKWDFPSLNIGTISFTTFPDFLIGLSGCAPGNVTCSPANPGATNGTAFSNEASSSLSERPSSSTGALDYYSARDISSYIQDDIKLTPRLTVNLGLRWEYDSFLTEADGKATNIWPGLVGTNPFPSVAAPCLAGQPCPGSSLVGYVVPSNFNTNQLGAIPTGVFQNNRETGTQKGSPLDNFAPRLGFALQPTHSARWVIRGGFGAYNDFYNGEVYIRNANQMSPYNVNIAAAGTANYFANLAVPFNPNAGGWVPRWIVTTPGPNFGRSSNLSQITLQPNLQVPELYQYNLNTQYEFAPSWILELGYVGSHGIHQASNPSVNPALGAGPATPVNCGYDGVATDCITTTSLSNVNLRVPYLGLSPSNSWYQVSSTGAVKFNSLQATVRKQFSHGLQFQAAYTWSSALATSNPNTTSTGLGVNAFYPVAQPYGLNPAYHPQRLAVSYIYDLPFPKKDGIVGKLTDGWSVSGVTTIQDGTPLTVTDSRGGSAFGTPVTSNAQYAAGMGPGNIGTAGTTSDKVIRNLAGGVGYLNPLAFTPPPVYTTNCPSNCGTAYGDSGLGVILGPGQDNWDISLVKTTVVGGLRENATLQFRTEFFNAFNHPQFTNPGVSVSTAATFGKITSLAVNPRLVQFALKYVF